MHSDYDAGMYRPSPRMALRMMEQVTKALSLIAGAKRPVTWGFVSANLGEPEFKTTRGLVEQKVLTKKHRGKTYYQITESP